MFTKTFKNISSKDISVAGGKGASLGEMTGAGIPVPPGFVVLTQAFEKFLKLTDLNVEIESILATVDTQKMHTVENASAKIQALTLEASIPLEIEKEIEKEFKKLKKCHPELDSGSQIDNNFFVAVRSSATAEDGSEAAWAGQLDSFLNTTEDYLLKNVQKCWASLFTPRAIFYRFEKGLHNTHISVAVVVQKMIQSEKSGIAFSVHPVTEDPNQLIIEAGFGLGEAIVSGSITPDSYVVNKLKVQSSKCKVEEAIIDVNISTQTKGLYKSCHLDRSSSLDDLERSGEISGNEWRDIPESQASSQVLNEKEILELSNLIIKIENHYGFPCDIEWAYEDGKFYITQSRPITTLKSFNTDENYNENKSHESKQKYVKIFNRPLYLIACQNFDQGERVKLKKISPIKYFMNPVLENIPGKGTNVYYNFTDVNQDPSHIIKYFNENKPKLFELKKTFYKDCDRLRSLLKKNNYFDYKKLSRLTIKIWPLIAISNMLGDNRDNIKDVDEEIVKLCREMRKYSDGLIHGSELKISQILLKILPQVYKKYYKYLTYEEVDKGNYPDTIELKNRSVGYIFHNGKLHTNITLNEYAKENNYIFVGFSSDTNNENELKGQVAYKGKTRGVVKVVLEIEDINKVKEGDILVASMTTPNFLSAMKKASAFVTDEGGITCHASIVAREIKKPCVIGTKIATQVLKDGDEVEVDALNHAAQGEANMGVVRILERANDKKLLRHIDEKVLEKEMEAFEGNKFDLFIRRRVPYFMDLYCIASYEVKKRWGLGIFFFEAGHKQVKNVWLDRKFNSETAEIWQKKMDEDPKFINSVTEELESIGKLSKDLAKNISEKNISGLNNDQLASLVVEHKNYWVKYFSIAYLWFAVDNIATNLQSQIKKNWQGTAVELKKFLSVAFSPSRFPASSREQRELLELKNLPESEFANALKKHAAKYAYLAVRDIDDKPFDIKYFEDRIGIFKQKDEYEKAKKEFARADKELQTATSLITNSDLPEELKKRITFCRDVAYLRTEVIEDLSMVNLVYQKVFLEIVERLNLEIDEVLHMLYEEIVGSLRQDKLMLSKEDVLDRKANGYAYLIAPNAAFFVTGEEVDRLQKIIIPEDESIKDVKIIKGVCAFEGKVQGKVRIIVDRNEIGKLEKGEILVTAMTTPDFVPAMRISSAIITNEGGILCHAAIMSRELGIPCIIGTKIATQVLKDGDEVEVDAERGVVKILERAGANDDDKNSDDEEDKAKPRRMIGTKKGVVKILERAAGTERRSNFDNKKDSLNKDGKKEFFKFHFPAYRYFTAVRNLSGIKFNGIHLWKCRYTAYTPDGMYYGCIPKEIYLEPGKMLLNLMIARDEKLEKKLMQLINDLLKITSEIQKIYQNDLKNDNVSTLSRFYPKQQEVFNKAMAFMYSLDYAIDEYLKKHPKIKIKPLYSSFLAEEEHELAQIFKINSKNEKESKLKEHLFKYSWIKTDYQGENHLQIKDLYDKAEDLKPANLTKRPDSIKKIPKNIEEWISLFIAFRDERKKLALLTTVLLDRYLKKECKELGHDYKKARCITVEEFEKYKHGELPDFREGRYEYVDPSGTSFYSKSEWEKLVEENDNSDTKTLKGLVATKGKIQGVARIILGKHDFHKMKDGDIIVASMTRPEFMPILKKAAAILTEQGGITCHASIISRELNVPCIIGIENLTQVIKDGDEVEVDASKGVVKIIKKAEDK